MNIKDITLKVDGLDITGRLYTPDKIFDPLPAVCIAHGIPSGQPREPGDRGYPGLAERFCDRGFIVLIFNFRGCDTSGGNLDMPAWKRDMGAAVDYLVALPETDNSRIALLGFSAGAAVSVCLAADDERVATVIACACPAAMRYEDPADAVRHFRQIGVIRDKDFPESVEAWDAGFESVRAIEVVERLVPRPLLLIHGSDDQTVPIKEAYQLYEKAGQKKQLVVIDGAGHRLRQEDRAMNIALDWLKYGAA